MICTNLWLKTQIRIHQKTKFIRVQLKLKLKLSPIIFAVLGMFWLPHSESLAQERPDYITEKTASFSLIIEGLANAKGEVRIAMFNSKDSYTKEPVYAVVLPVDSTVVDWKVDELPFGEYAIAVYHDKNANGKLDTNLLGIPKERYGFSNNARGRFGPASWMDSHFYFDADLSSHTIQVK
jgi:uncharacterized protein (DUF2141 family)